jgi:hypothetical protein
MVNTRSTDSVVARKPVESVFGALLATQSGREIDIVNSFELLHSRDESGKVTIDKDYLVMKQEQCMILFPLYFCSLPMLY